MVVVCGPRGLPTAHNALYRNNRDGTFTDVSEKAGILAPGGRYGPGVVVADFDNDGWPDIYVACDQTPSLSAAIDTTGPLKNAGVQRALPTMPMATSRPAWASRSRITTAMGFSTSRRPISPATGHRCTLMKTASGEVDQFQE